MTLTADKVMVVTDGSTDAANGSPAQARPQKASPPKASPQKASTGSKEAGTGSKEAGTGSKEALSYEQARDKLAAVVKRLEAGGLTLEQSLELWERGERLAAVCGEWLDGARARLAAAMAKRDDGDQPAGEDDAPF
jgi:exodeoxyribonuclease VII small subunit